MEVENGQIKTPKAVLYLLIAILAVACFGAFMAWSGSQMPETTKKEIDALKSKANAHSDSLSGVIRKRDSTIAYLTVISAWVDTQEVYIGKLERALAEKAINLKEDNKKFEEKKKAIANETDMESIKGIKGFLNRKK